MLPNLRIFHRRTILAAAFLSSLSWPAMAETSQDEQIDERFAAADADHDGQLTPAEAAAGMPRIAAKFDKIDADKSGTVSLAEIKAVADR
jgi:EF hand